ncbi:hypothetical protein COY28_03165, partial [Candidatus Woesearchaeota archaeon CG_4_10_14_0_2_um_filter_57_5]
MTDFPKAYTALAEQYGLPSTEELNEFDLSEPSDPLLRFVRHRMQDRFASVLEVLEGILSPEQCVTQMHEQQFLNETERKQAWECYRLLMYLDREHARLELVASVQADATFITTAFARWQETKPELLALFTRMRDSWHEETNDE